MTPEQKETFVKVALTGVTLGFYHFHEWIAAYEETLDYRFLPDPEVRERLLMKASEAMAAFLDETGPREHPMTTEEVWEMSAAHFRSCCFPGCFKEGVFAVPGKETTNLILCELHEGCIKAPVRRVK